LGVREGEIETPLTKMGVFTIGKFFAKGVICISAKTKSFHYGNKKKGSG
jgi:hypothetical protein